MLLLHMRLDTARPFQYSGQVFWQFFRRDEPPSFEGGFFVLRRTRRSPGYIPFLDWLGHISESDSIQDSGRNTHPDALR